MGPLVSVWVVMFMLKSSLLTVNIRAFRFI